MRGACAAPRDYADCETLRDIAERYGDSEQTVAANMAALTHAPVPAA